MDRTIAGSMNDIYMDRTIAGSMNDIYMDSTISGSMNTRYLTFYVFTHSFFWKNSLDNHLLTPTFVNCRLTVT